MGYHREPPTSSFERTPAPQRALDAGAPARLVLVVGAQSRPQRAWADCLSERGLRCIWEADVEHLASLQGQVLFDAVVADVSGVDDGCMVGLLARVRQLYRGRVLVVSDSHDEVDEIMALELGADDFLVTPLSARRLRAHLLALLRPESTGAAAASRPPEPGPPVTTLGGWRLDAARLRLQRGEQAVELTTTQAQLLQCLAHHAGRLVPRAELHERICPGASDIRARTIDVYVHRLRRRLADAGVTGIHIEAVRGRGFVLHADVDDGIAAGPHPGPAAVPLHSVYLKA